MELAHFGKHFVENKRKIGPAGKNLGIFSPRQSKSYILHGKFNPKIDTISKIRAIFFPHQLPPPTTPPLLLRSCASVVKKRREEGYGSSP